MNEHNALAEQMGHATVEQSAQVYAPAAEQDQQTTARAATAEPDLTELGPLVRVIIAAMQEVPVTLGTPAGCADLAATIAVRVAVYVGRKVLPPSPLTGRTATLTAAERQFLSFALDLATDRMASLGDEFDTADEAALEKLRRLAAEEQPAAEVRP
jgi:hypothetical protein